MHRLAFDIGGTFTDFVLQDGRTGRLDIWKVPSTPDEPARAVIDSLRQHAAETGIDLAQVTAVLHATTVATNAILERTGSPTALITTLGFRDVLLLGRAKRPDTNDLHVVKPAPLVPRSAIFEVPERMSVEGRVLTVLDEGALAGVVERIRAAGFVSVAVMFLHSYINPAHEQRVRAVIEAAGLAVDVTLSSDISPKSREYERASTTVANAYVKPLVGRYIDELGGGLVRSAVPGRLSIMQSNGGLVSAGLARSHPIRIVESGPAAGVLMCADVGRQLGHSHVMTFDMGGTTAKLGAIEDGEPAITATYEVDAVNARKGSGLPLSITAIELLEIGAGGGSVADTRMGLITVGPHSAGAMPGPICYGRGGVRPTITDANLVLGYLNPHYFNGGAMTLDAVAAASGVRQHIGEPLGLDTVAAAWGIHSVANSNMERAMRVISVERGRDPRQYVLIAFGGAGPLHACRLARAVGVQRVIVPYAAGVGSAIGLLVADYKVDASVTRVLPLDGQAEAAMAQTIGELEQRALAEAVLLGVAGEAVMARSAAMRHVGQGYEIRVDLPPGRMEPGFEASVREAFYTAYKREYGYVDPQSGIEIIDWYVTATIRNEARMALQPGVTPRGQGAITGEREAFFPESGGMTRCKVLDRYAMLAGSRTPGPCFVEERESTTVVLPGDVVSVDDRGHLIIDIGATR